MSRSAPRVLVFVSCVAFAAAARAAVGPEFPVCTTAGEQQDLVAIADGAGGAYVAWTDRGADPGGNIHVLRLTPAGEPDPAWPAGGLPLATSGTAEHRPQLVSDDAGGVICVWQVPLTSGIHTLYAARLSPMALRLWGDLPRALTPEPETYARAPESVSIVGDGDGGVWVSYLALRHAIGVEAIAHAHHMSRLGTLDVEAPLTSIVTVTHGPTGLARDAAGNVFVCWSETRLGSGDADLRLQKLGPGGDVDPAFDPDGRAIGGSLANQYAPAMASDGAGGAWIGWLDRVGGDPEVTVLRIDPDGLPRPGWPDKGIALTRDAATQGPPLVRALADGVVAMWEDSRDGTRDLWAGALTGAGVVAAGWGSGAKPIAVTTGHDESGLVADVLADGSLVAAWERAAPADSADVFAARLTPTGAVLPWPQSQIVRGEPAVAETRPAVVADGTGGAFVFWLDGRSGGLDVYGRRVELPIVLTAPPPPAGLALLGTWPSPVRGAAQLAFILPDAAPAAVALYDVGGRRLWRREVGTLGAGRHALPLPAGLPAGLHVARLEHARGAVAARVVILD